MSTTAAEPTGTTGATGVGGDVDVVAFPTGRPRAVGNALNVLVVTMIGQLIVPNRQAFRTFMLDELEAGRRRFVLDMSECGYIDAAGLGVLVTVSKAAAKVGGRVIVAAFNSDLETLFELTRLDEVLWMAKTLLAGIAAFGQGGQVEAPAA